MEVLQSLGIDPKFILISIVGFSILVIVLKKFAFGPLLGVLEQRQTTIKGNLDEAEARRNEMVRLQHEYEERLSKIEDEARDKIQSAIRDAQAARDEIIAKAQADSHAIVARGAEELAQERAKAMEEMRNEVAELAIQVAGRVVKQNLDASNHARLIDDVIGSISATNGRGAGSAL